MKSQFVGIVLFSLILVFVISFGNVNSFVKFEANKIYGPENLMLSTPTYYVGPSGDNGNDGDSVGSAWATVSYAMTQLSSTSGYILHVGVGTFNDSFEVSSSGTSLSHNQILGDTDGSIFSTSEGSIQITASGNDNGILINGKEYIDVSGITVSSSDEDGVKIYGDSDNISLYDVTVTSAGSSGDYSSILVEGTSSSVFPNDVSIEQCSITGDYYGIKVYNYCEDISIGSNTITGCSEAGDVTPEN